MERANSIAIPRRRAAIALLVAALVAPIVVGTQVNRVETPRFVWHDGVAAEIPPAGTGVRLEADTPSGHKVLTVITQKDGTVSIGRDNHGGSSGNEASLASTAVSGKNPCPNCPTECKDGAYSLLSYKESTGLNWYFKRSSAPSNVGADAAQSALIAAANRVKNSSNACRITDQVSAVHTFLGDTTASSNISKDIRCLANDNQSTVDFAPLNAPAVTCAWFSVLPGVDEVSAADIRINSGTKWTTKPGSSSCRRAYDVQGLAAHEFGHAFGLGHVSPSHGNLTMSTYGLPDCSSAYRTFGKGDVKGLQALY
ncbi:MAG: matrixin family metalloprotease [Actinomycetota bacterium]